MRAGALGLAILLALPLAAAVPAEGVLMATALLAPSGATAEVELTALFAPETAELGSLTLRSPSVTIRTFDASYLEVDLPGLRPQVSTAWREATYELTDVVVELAVGADHEGWLGAWLGVGSATMTGRGPAEFRATDGGRIGNGDVGGGDDWHFFLAEGSGPQTFVSTSGSWALQGETKLKLNGPDLVLRARENTTSLVTGWESGSESAREVRVRWATITASDATFTFDSPRIVDALAGVAEVSWDGRARLDGTVGTLGVGREAAVFDSETAYLSGRLHASLLPTTTASTSQFQAQVTGEIEEAALSSGNVRAAATSSSGWPWLLAIGIAVAAGGGAVLLKRSSARPHPQVVVPSEQPLLSAEECVGLADLAAEAEDFRTALAWIRRAKHFAPTSARILLDEGFFLESLGEHDEAVATYEAASRLQPQSGEADLYLARLRLKSGAHASDIEGFLVRALEKSPLLLLEVEDDGSWGPVLKRPAVVSALAKAHAELD